MTEDALLAAIRAAPHDDGPRLVYADWLMARGDVRGELVSLEVSDRRGALGPAGRVHLQALVAAHGYPHPELPPDPVAQLPWHGGGTHPTQYGLTHEGHHWYVRQRYGFTIDLDGVEIVDADVDWEDWNHLSPAETNVVLTVLTEAILAGDPPGALQAAFDALEPPAHPAYHAGRHPLVSAVEARDYERYCALLAAIREDRTGG
ncbi:MAG: TIGR02996 domain-containing protein [Myxococcota bacterium]